MDALLANNPVDREIEDESPFFDLNGDIEEQSFDQQRDKLKTLMPSHKNVFKLYVLGYSRGEIALATGFGESWINVILKSEIGKKYISKLDSQMDDEFRRMHGKMTQVIRESMDHNDARIQLAGAALYAKVSGNEKLKVEFSAEDVVKKIVDGNSLPE